MKALVKYGKEFGGYRYEDVPEPVCGPEDIILRSGLLRFVGLI